jgi:membrane-bound inhibitor of C-type lysozyme
MRRLFFIRFKIGCIAATFFLVLPIVAFAGDKLRDRSPDGQFALSVKDESDEEVSITLVDTKTHKLVEKLSDSGHSYSDTAHIVWSPDSKRFAYSEENRKSITVQLYIRKDSGFEEVELPDIPECDHPGSNGFVLDLLTPKRWPKPDTLILTSHDEWSTEDGDDHECDRTVTITIDSSGKASVKSIQENKKK